MIKYQLQAVRVERGVDETFTEMQTIVVRCSRLCKIELQQLQVPGLQPCNDYLAAAAATKILCGFFFFRLNAVLLATVTVTVAFDNGHCEHTVSSNR